jgi:hypothetical protein
MASLDNIVAHSISFNFFPSEIHWVAIVDVLSSLGNATAVPAHGVIPLDAAAAGVQPLYKIM